MYKKLEMVINGLSDDEVQMLIDAPGVLNDKLFISALRAKRSGVSDETLWTRIAMLTSLQLASKDFNPNLFYTLRGTISLTIELTQRSIGKIKRFSGYVRNSSAVGSKRNSGLNRREPEHFQWNSNEETDYYHFLTVGELKTTKALRSHFTLKSSDRTKRNPNKQKE
jgi:hypothetical protein